VGATGVPSPELQSSDEAAEEEENYGAHGRNPDRPEIELTGHHGAPSEESGSEPATDEGADDSEKYGDDATRRVPPWHQKFRQGPGNEAKDDPIEPERQTLYLREASGALRNARSATASRRHPVDPEQDQSSYDSENDALDGEPI